MTPSGRDALHRAEAAQQTLEDEILLTLDVEERAQLSHLLRKALEAHTTTGAPAEPSVLR
jgi:DNA-binding MarR family transcriptional regulator